METSTPSETSIKDYYPDQNQQLKQPSSKPLIAGIFLIIGGLSGLLTAAMILAFDLATIQSVFPAEFPYSPEQLQSVLSICGIIIAICSIITFAGGIVAIKRKAWSLAVIGGILGLFTIGLMFLGSILSLIGLILVLISRKDFE
ncbi:MAG: hypothetical protein JW840_10325 [Candidatus Thermoplasmatota archaeon]|nr:hypothetical protein [Candidatus Thermoplasmatota archaeon]